MAARTYADALQWVLAGTDLLVAHVRQLDDGELSAPSALPGWTRKHLIAHVAANAEALSNLVRWAKTGEPTPMYTSPDQRDADIAAGGQRSAAELRAWLDESALDLAAGLDSLTDEQWRAEVVTAQGRAVPATEIPWLRAREVCVHAVDLDTGVTFDDLPRAFLEALVVDIRGTRGLDAIPTGSWADQAAYLAGRPHALVNAVELGPWL